MEMRAIKVGIQGLIANVLIFSIFFLDSFLLCIFMSLFIWSLFSFSASPHCLVGKLLKVLNWKVIYAEEIYNRLSAKKTGLILNSSLDFRGDIVSVHILGILPESE